MKKFKIFALTLIVSHGITSSCTDLEETMYSGLAAKDFVPTPEDLALLIGPAYSSMRAFVRGLNTYCDLQELTADAMVIPVRPHGWYGGGIFHRMHRHEWTITQEQIRNVWMQCMTTINHTNRVIFQIESGDIPLTGDVKTKTLAELRGIRAWVHYLLMDAYGNIPLVTNFADPNPPQQFTRRQAFDFIESELLEVLPYLEDRVIPASYGRFTKWAALMTLGRLYLNAGVYIGTPRWQDVINVADQIINSGLFRLEATYRANFITRNEGSRENIFVVPFDDILATGWAQHVMTLAPRHRLVLNMVASPWGGTAGVPQFIDNYHPHDTRRADTWIGGPQRHHATGAVLFTYDNWLPGIGSPYTSNTTMYNGFRIGKYEIAVGARGSLSNDFAVFRYAEVLMNKAEALLRLGQADAAAALVTQVRERAFRANPAYAVVTGAQLLEDSGFNFGWYQYGVVTRPDPDVDIMFGRFLDELGWEFAQEGRRRKDLIRFGVFTTKTWLNRGTPASPHEIIFPIPEAAMLTNPNLRQNPGY